MEHQSSVTYGNQYKKGYLGRDLSGTGWGLKFDYIIIHETGHEWFANNITYKDIADMWVHEGFTTYSEKLFVDYHFGKKASSEYVIGTRRGIRNQKPIIGPYNVNKGGSGDMYSKGANLLHTLRQLANNDLQWRNILRGLNKDFYHKTVTTQEIENYRTDVRTINTSLIATDWYIDQMKKRTYNSSPIPSQLKHSKYAYGIRDYIKYEALIDSVRWNIKDFMNWISSDHPRTKYKNLLTQYGADLENIPMFTQNMVFYPTNKIRVPINKKNVLESGIVKAEKEDLIVDYICLLYTSPSPRD